jgi:hypothetical protein
MTKRLSALLLAALVAIPGCAFDTDPAAPADDEVAAGEHALKKPPPGCTEDPSDCPPEPPDPPPPPPGPPPKPVVSEPDFVMEMVTPVSCNFPGVGDGVIAAMQDNFGSAVVDFSCEQNTHARVGLWSRALAANEDHAARLRGLAAMNVTQGSETAGMRIPTLAIMKGVEKGWADQPKDLGHDGKPHSGPVHLTDHALNFDPNNNRVSFSVSGYDTTPVPDLDFTVKTTSTFALQGSHLACTSSVDFSKDDVIHWALGGIFLVASFLSPYIAPVGVLLAEGFFIEGTIISSVGAPGGDAASFCSLAKLIPEKILLHATPPVIPARQKLVFTYNRLDIKKSSVDAGISVAGSWAIVPRSPRVLAGGTMYLDIEAPPGWTGGTLALTADAVAYTDEMLQPTFTWQPQTGGTLGTPTSSATAQARKITWSVPNLHIGDVVTRTFTVSAVDEEGLQASGSSQFVFTIVLNHLDDDDICDKKPSLPQCQAGGDL